MIDEDDDEEDDENYQVDFDEDDDDDDEVPKNNQEKPAGGGLTRMPGSNNIQKLGDEDDSESDSEKEQFADLGDLKQANLSPTGKPILNAPQASGPPQKISEYNKDSDSDYDD